MWINKYIEILRKENELKLTKISIKKKKKQKPDSWLDWLKDKISLSYALAKQRMKFDHYPHVKI